MIKKWLEPHLSNLAPWLLDTYFEQPLWMWIALPICLISACVIAVLLVRLISDFLGWVCKKRYRRFYERYVLAMLGPLGLWVCVAIFAALVHLLPLPDNWSKNFNYIFGALVVFALVLGVFRLITNAGESLRDHFIAHDKSSAAAIIPLMRKLLKTLLAAMALLFILQNWGFDVMALLAGLGIGGIALALASQKSVENLFGGVSITLDQPVRVGDFISFGNESGTVEDIGLRSTSIRSRSRTRVTIPNSQFSEMQLENFAARDKMLLHKTLGLRYETSPVQIRAILAGIRALLDSHDDVEHGCRVRFIEFGASSLDIEIFGYVTTTDYPTFLGIQEEILLSLMDIIKQGGSDFAFPSTTVYLEHSEGLSAPVSTDEQ